MGYTLSTIQQIIDLLSKVENINAKSDTYANALKTLLETYVPIDTLQVITSNSSIILDFNGSVEKVFVGITSFTGSKTIALLNNTIATVFTFHFQVTGASAIITFPSNFKSSDSRFVTSVLTLTGAGYYEITCSYDTVNDIWKLKAEKDGGVL